MPESTLKVINYLQNDKNKFTDAKYLKDNTYKVASSVQPLFQRIDTNKKNA